MTNGLARASIRFRPASFAGTFVALLAAATVVMACGSLLQTGITANAEPVRYADAPVVVAADQYARRMVGSGEDASEEAELLPEGARLNAELADRIAGRPGVARAVADLAVPLQSTDLPSLTGRDWSTTAITSAGADPLIQGRTPRAREVVIDAVTADAAGLEVGDTVDIVAPSGAGSFRLVGLAATATDTRTAWFADGVSASLAGGVGQADAIAVFARPGVATSALDATVRDAVGDDVDVYTGTGRGQVEDPELAEGRELLASFGGSFGGIATMTAVFVVLATVALAVGQRRREIALLRAIGATPRQIRRTVATEALLVAPLAGALGIVPGILLARWWFGQLVERGAIPEGVAFSTGWIPAVATIGAGLVAALVGGYIAARRPARTPPILALGEAAVERRRLGMVRIVLGVAALAGGIVTTALSVTTTGDDAAGASLGVVMLFMFAVSLLGPVIADVGTTVLGIPVRGGGAAGALAVANTRANARRLASAITPIVLVIAFCGTLLFINTTVARATAADVRDGVVADHILSSTGPGLPTGTDRQVAGIAGVETAVGVLRSGVLYSAGGTFLEASAIGLTGAPTDIPAVLDLDIEDGSLASLTGDTVALDAIVADSAGVDVGEPLELWLGDGTVITPRVAATYERGLGLGQVLLAREVLAPHVQAAFDAHVLVQHAPGADRGAVARALGALDVPNLSVADRAGYAAQVDEELELSEWAHRIMAGVLGGFAAVAAVNTLVMVVLDRRREVALLRLTGTTRRQVRAMFRWEALIMAATGVVLGSAIAWLTLIGFARGVTGGAPHVPPLQPIVIAAATVLVVLLANAAPSRVLLRQAPIAGIE
jgi:putative ABC transport system permease protein